MWHCRAAHCLSQTTGSATSDLGAHLQMIITLQLQPAEHLDKEYATAGTANTSFQHTAAKQSYPFMPGGRPASLQAAERFGCLFSTRKAVKSLSESTTQTDMLQQTRWMGNLPANSTGLLLVTCVNCGIYSSCPHKSWPPLQATLQTKWQLQEVTLPTLPQKDMPRDNSQHIGSLIPNSTSACFPLNPQNHFSISSFAKGGTGCPLACFGTFTVYFSLEGASTLLYFFPK